MRPKTSQDRLIFEKYSTKASSMLTMAKIYHTQFAELFYYLINVVCCLNLKYKFLAVLVRPTDYYCCSMYILTIVVLIYSDIFKVQKSKMRIFRNNFLNVLGNFQQKKSYAFNFYLYFFIFLFLYLAKLQNLQN